MIGLTLFIVKGKEKHVSKDNYVIIVIGIDKEFPSETNFRTNSF